MSVSDVRISQGTCIIDGVATLVLGSLSLRKGVSRNALRDYLESRSPYLSSVLRTVIPSFSSYPFLLCVLLHTTPFSRKSFPTARCLPRVSRRHRSDPDRTFTISSPFGTRDRRTSNPILPPLCRLGLFARTWVDCVLGLCVCVSSVWSRVPLQDMDGKVLRSPGPNQKFRRKKRSL